MHPDQTLVFFHIPKTAGTSLSVAMARFFSPEKCFVPGQDGRTQIEDCRRFVALPEAERGAYRFLRGHLEMPVLDSLPGPHYAFTFLRSPVKRMISLYNFVRRTPSHHLHAMVSGHGLSLAAFVARAPWDEVRNGMTRRLAGVVGAPMPAFDARLLKRALANLETRMRFVGLQERFDESLFMLGRDLGLPPGDLFCAPRNVDAQKRKRQRPDAATVEAIRRHNRMDQIVYDEARERFRVKATALKGRLKREYAAFRKLKREFLKNAARPDRRAA